MNSTCNNQSPTLFGIIFTSFLFKGVLFFQENTRIPSKLCGVLIVTETLGMSKREKVLMRLGGSRVFWGERMKSRVSTPLGNSLVCSNLQLRDVPWEPDEMGRLPGCSAGSYFILWWVYPGCHITANQKELTTQAKHITQYVVTNTRKIG